MLRSIRKRLGIKLFFSYLVVVLVGVLVLATTAQLAIPAAFNQHMAGMDSSFSGMMGGSTASSARFKVICAPAAKRR